MLEDIPSWLIWALLVAVVVQGFSMALLVYLMFRRDRKRSEEPPAPPPEKGPEKPEVE